MAYPVPSPETQEQDVALFIDWENIKFSLINAGYQPNISSLYEAARGYGRVVIARAYADWQEEWHLEDPAALYDAGVEPVYVPVRGKGERRKNSVDIKLASDCIEVRHIHPSIRTFILCSGDADFVHVVNSLRPYGKRVIVIGISWTTSMHLMGSVDEMLFYDQDVEPSLAPVSARQRMAPAVSLPPLPNGKSLGNPEVDRAARTVLDIVRQSQKEGRALLAYIKHELIKRMGGFDERTYGFTKFKLFMKELERHGLIKVVTRELVDWAYVPEVAEQEGIKEDEELTRTASFDDGTMSAFLRAVDRVQRAHEFTSFNFLIGRIYELNELPLSRTQLKALCNLAVDRGFFERGQHTRVDHATGEISDIRTLILKREHADVQRALNPQGVEDEADELSEDARLNLILEELSRAPDNPTLLQSAAERSAELGRWGEALAFQEQLVAVRPDDVRTHCVYARYLQSAGRTADALEYLQQTVSHFPESYMPPWTQGSMYNIAGEPDKALAPLRRAQSLLPRDRDDLHANLLWHLARTYLELERRDEAAALTEEGLSLRPMHVPLQQLQSQL